jgi:hypothetical protein
MDSEKKVLYYNHTKDYEKHIQEWNQVNSKKSIKYFKYIPLCKIIDAPHMTQPEYFNYVMIKYGDIYHNFLNYMKNKKPIDPIYIDTCCFDYFDDEYKYIFGCTDQETGKTPYEFYTD